VYNESILKNLSWQESSLPAIVILLNKLLNVFIIFQGVNTLWNSVGDTKMSWTDDRVATLKKLWGEGKTAAEIAKELGGVTRNAVIGKAHRLKLSNRVSPIQQNKKVAAPKPQNQNKKPVEAIQPRKRAKEYVDDGRERIPLTDLQAGGCRWPMGDPREKDFGFCGCAALPSLPYCLEHSQVAYQPATRNRILKDQGTKETVSAEEMATAKKAVASK